MLRARAEKEFSPLTAEECERDALRFGHIAKRLEEVWSGNRRNRTQLLVRLRVAVRTHLDLLRRFGQTESFYLHELGPYHLRRIAADAPPGTFAVDAVGDEETGRRVRWLVRVRGVRGRAALQAQKKEGVRAVRTRDRSERRRAREKRRSEEEQRESVGGGGISWASNVAAWTTRRPPRGGSGAASARYKEDKERLRKRYADDIRLEWDRLRRCTRSTPASMRWARRQRVCASTESMVILQPVRAGGRKQMNR